ncbi:hypothetical protein HHI36_014968, partial [Cryptolaemus montrouzieri]
MSAHILEEVKFDLVGNDWDYDSVDVNILYDNILENVKDSMDNLDSERIARVIREILFLGDLKRALETVDRERLL